MFLKVAIHLYSMTEAQAGEEKGGEIKGGRKGFYEMTTESVLVDGSGGGNRVPVKEMKPSSQGDRDIRPDGTRQLQGGKINKKRWNE